MQAIQFLEPHYPEVPLVQYESFEDKVERIAQAWIERPCPPEEEPYCNPAMHNWDTTHPEDKAWAREHVTFALHEAGLG